MKVHTNPFHALARLIFFLGISLSASQAVQISTPAVADLQVEEREDAGTGEISDGAAASDAPFQWNVLDRCPGVPQPPHS